MSTDSNESITTFENTDKIETIPAPAKKPRGFAAMDRSRVAEIARTGGKEAHKRGTAHRFSSEEARNAGKKGGTAAHKSRGRTKIQHAETATAIDKPTLNS